MKKITFLMALFMVSIGYAQAPTDNAADPTRSASDVVGVYGDTYSQIGTNFDPNWGQAGHNAVNTAYDPGTGKTVLAYPGFNYQGTEVTATNLAAMDGLHVDVWVPTGTSRLLKVSPINSGTGAAEFLVEVPLTPGSWNSVDIPKSSFTGMSWDNIIQLKFDGQFNADGSANTTDTFDVYLDNIYFYKTPVASGTDATLSDIKVDGASISNFSSGTTTYLYGLKEGVTTVPQITAATTTDSNATTSITQASSVPGGSATVEVTAQDGTTKITYTVNFEYTMPSGNPTDPNIDSNDVVGIYGDTYNSIVTNIDPNWGQSGHGQVNGTYDPGNGKTILALPNFNYQGMEVTATDLSGMDVLRLDVWAPTGANRMLKISPINGGTGAGEVLVEVPLTPGSWNNVVLNKSQFTGMTWDNVIQLKFDGQFNADGSANTESWSAVYIDNIYFYAAATASVETNELFNVSVYPNPSNNVVNLTANEIITKAEVFNVIGKKMRSFNVNSNSTSINISDLNPGIYVLKYEINNKVGTTKFVKN
ncbi:MAG: hypothetical protein CMB99_07820 [Flavobacteriaceae bacterium]|nr:hypothetical protein [Flavobacteriaceae bacterium]|tara:strand:- start:12195 stop:13796 length:1602 start_codon:yes stop_codon:yes gene_type:complete